MYIRKSNSPKTGPSGTPHVILEVLDAKPLIDTNCLQFAEFYSNHLPLSDLTVHMKMNKAAKSQSEGAI